MIFVYSDVVGHPKRMNTEVSEDGSGECKQHKSESNSPHQTTPSTNKENDPTMESGEEPAARSEDLLEILQSPPYQTSSRIVVENILEVRVNLLELFYSPPNTDSSTIPAIQPRENKQPSTELFSVTESSLSEMIPSVHACTQKEVVQSQNDLCQQQSPEITPIPGLNTKKSMLLDKEN